MKYTLPEWLKGSVKWISVRWTLYEWLMGSKKQDEEPYLSGFIPMLQSAMAYRGAKTLKEFRS